MNNPASQTTEFDCMHCATRLKVPMSSVGKQAKCPNCQAVVTVPQPVVPVPNQVDTVVPGSMQTTSQPSASSQSPAASDAPAQAASKTPAPMAVGAASQPTATVPAAPTAAPTETAAPNREAEQVFGEDTETRRLYDRVTEEVSKIFVGQEELVQGTLVALFSGGHVLIESVPGLGKTLFVRTLGKALGCDFGRIQFTADLMPSDITGAPIFNMKTQEFRFRPGPVFTQLLLADEINRSPAKTHAALLEIMQEKHVTIDGTTHELTPPFLVMATQNPIESEGTYNLPEAQLDRFMFKLIADYPSEQEEAEILQLHGGQRDLDARLKDDIQQVTDPEEIVRVTQANSEVRVDPTLVDYINKIVRQTRVWPAFYMGASPRAGIGLMQGARTLAAFRGRDYAVPDDVVEITLPTLRHRVMLTAEAEVEGQVVDQLLRDLIRTIEVPRGEQSA